MQSEKRPCPACDCETHQYPLPLVHVQRLAQRLGCEVTDPHRYERQGWWCLRCQGSYLEIWPAEQVDQTGIGFARPATGEGTQ